MMKQEEDSGWARYPVAKLSMSDVGLDWYLYIKPLLAKLYMYFGFLEQHDQTHRHIPAIPLRNGTHNIYIVNLIQQ